MRSIGSPVATRYIDSVKWRFLFDESCVARFTDKSKYRFIDRTQSDAGDYQVHTFCASKPLNTAGDAVNRASLIFGGLLNQTNAG